MECAVEAEALIIAREVVRQGGTVDLLGVGATHLLPATGFPFELVLWAFARIRVRPEESRRHHACLTVTLNGKDLPNRTEGGSLEVHEDLSHAALLFEVRTTVTSAGDLRFSLLVDHESIASANLRVLTAARE